MSYKWLFSVLLVLIKFRLIIEFVEPGCVLTDSIASSNK